MVVVNGDEREWRGTERREERRKKKEQRIEKRGWGRSPEDCGVRGIYLSVNFTNSCESRLESDGGLGTSTPSQKQESQGKVR